MRERILVIGPPNSGKTYQWLRLADFLLKKESKARFFVIDTDDSVNRMLSSDTFSTLRNAESLRLFPVYNWPEYVSACQHIMDESRDEDWAIVDMIDEAWKAVQRHFVSEVFKDNMGDYFLEVRKQLAEKGDKTNRGKEARHLQVLKGWLDWPVINRMYDDFIMPLVFRAKANLYCTAKPTAISEDDDAIIRELFGPFGVRPTGQKSLAHQFHTVLLFAQNREGWVTTTIKDRERIRLDHAPMGNFAIHYLLKVAKVTL